MRSASKTSAVLVSGFLWIIQGGQKAIYPKEAICEAGLNQKRENLLHALWTAALFELHTHNAAVLPLRTSS
jgi:hypothetical protein